MKPYLLLIPCSAFLLFSCATAKTKQTSVLTVDSTHKVIVKDTTIHVRTEIEKENTKDQYERVTTITPTIIRDSNIIRVYPTTVITEKGEKTIEYIKNVGDSLANVSLRAEVSDLKSQLRESYKEKESKPDWAFWFMLLFAAWIILSTVIKRKPT